MVQPRKYVESPSFTPLPFGLLSTLATEIRNPAEPHWQLGVNYESVCLSGGTTYLDCYAVSGTGSAPAAVPGNLSANASIERRGATAFSVYTRLDCSAAGFWERADRLGSEAFTESEQWQVERAFWTGLAAGQPVVYPHLAANAVVVDESSITLQTAATAVSGNAVDIVEGLGALEKALADCNDGVGVIHVPRNLAPALANSQLLIQEGGRYRTHNGNVVVLGSGYPGTSPAGVAPALSTWIYATGPMFIYRSAAELLGANGQHLNRDDNTLPVFVSRRYLLAWECCHLAVNISTGGITTGTVGVAT